MREQEKPQDKIIKSFKELMKDYPFDKITVTMITDKTGIQRPTFYTYFKDKYELMDYMLYMDITREVTVLLKHKMLIEAIRLMFTQINSEKELYRKLFEVTGQNSFEQVMVTQFVEMLQDMLDFFKPDLPVENEFLSPMIICEYHVLGLTMSIKAYLNSTKSAPIDDVVETYYFLVSHSIFDLLDEDFKSKERQKH